MSKNYLSNAVSAFVGLYAVNSLIDLHAKSLAARQPVKGHYFDWKYGKIFYRVKGQGEPILLIHNLGHRSASYEWDDIIHLLSKNHTVYSVDLPGCGRSDKPGIIYTSYLYVQFLHEFTTQIITEKPTLIVSHDSAPFCIAANGIYKDKFKKVIIINPEPITHNLANTDIFKYSYMKILYLPIIGESVYNIENFSYNAFRPDPINKRLSDSSISFLKNAYISSHLQKSNGRYLRGSKVNNYTFVNYKEHLKDSDNVTLIMSMGLSRAKNTIRSYIHAQPKLNIVKLDSKSDFPYMDFPGKVYSALGKII